MKWFRKSFKRVLLTSVPLILKILIVGAQVSVTPTAPPAASSSLTTVLGYLQWLGIVGGVGVGALIAGIKIAMMHDMEGGKRDLIFSIIGGVIISLVATVLNLFI
jgi:hypothetical protein